MKRPSPPWLYVFRDLKDAVHIVEERAYLRNRERWLGWEYLGGRSHEGNVYSVNRTVDTASLALLFAVYDAERT